MVLDALRGYLQLASGITEEPRQRAAAAARSLLTQGDSVEAAMPGHLQQQVSALAEELVITSRANRELLLGLIRTEVERTLARLGIASADEVHALRRSVERLERLVRAQQAAAEGDERGETTPTSQARRAGRTAAAAPKKEKKTPPTTTAATTSAASRARTSAGTRSRATTAGQMSSTGSRRASRPAGEASTVGENGDPAATTRSAGRRRRVPTDADANPDAEE
jgi:hypothetical protein